MCGRYAVTLPPEAMRHLFGVDGAMPVLAPRYNVAPSQPVPVVRRDQKGGREVTLVRWGLVPSFAKAPDPSAPMINARAETAAEKPSFRGPLRHRRAVFPMDGFYEWRRAGPGPKQPFFITRADGAPIIAAGLWELWTGPDGEEIESAAMLTTAANRELAPIHDRMPVILEPETLAAWLDPKTSPKELAALMVTAPAGTLTLRPVSTRVNSTGNDDAGLIEAVTMAAEPAPAPKKAKSTDQMDLFG